MCTTGLRILLVVGLLIGGNERAWSQPNKESMSVPDADSVYIVRFVRKNDVRIFYGGQANRLVLGSLEDGSPRLSGDIYKNTNDYIGIGITYKWLDGDLAFSLPGTTYLREERSNLDQFRLAGGYSKRKVAFRMYLSDSKGKVISGNHDEYESSVSIHEFKIALQATFVLNYSRYSYQAALYQSEKQKKTSGSFLLRIEPFYRNLGGSGQPIVPEAYDTEERFGDQVGLTYVRAPGILIMPGYGANVVRRNMFLSPMLLVGAGGAFNNYRSDKGEGRHFNIEYSGYFLMNAGYSGARLYSRAQFCYVMAYSPITPAYLSSNDLMVSILIGYRFRDVETLIPKL